MLLHYFVSIPFTELCCWWFHCCVSACRDEESEWSHFREQGLDYFRQQQRVNGGVAFSSPFAAADQLDTFAMRRRTREANAAAAVGTSRD